MKLSNNNKTMIYASKKGYIVDKKGNVYFKNKKRALRTDSTGFYLSFTISVKTKSGRCCRSVWVHQLQAYQKYGRKMFLKGIQVRHFNGNSKDNSWKNILIGSASENHMDKPAKTRKMMAVYASYKNRRFTDKEVAKIKKDKKSGMSYNKLVVKYKTSKSTLSYLFNNAMYNK